MKRFLVYLAIVPLFFVFGCNGGSSFNINDSVGSSPSNPCKDKAVIDTTTGSFCAASDSPGNVNAYKGIKYAKGGQAFRWQSPIAADDFTTPKEAGTFGDVCAQVDTSILGVDALAALTDDSNISLKGSEDCLFLNVYAPKEVQNEKKPVMVWIPGGAFLLGTGSDVTFDPKHIVELEDVVVVTLNYRLGIFGFLNLPEAYKKEGVSSANFGLQDQAMVIKWVYDNIEHFGGDKEKITIMGESAGSMSVGFHLVNNDSPTSDYFRAAIMQSPYMGFPVKTDEHAQEVGSFTANLMIEACKDDNVSDPIQCLYETLSTEDIVVNTEVQGLIYYLFKTLTSGSFSNIFPYEPYIDNDMVKSNLIDSEIKKPLLIGNNKSESNFLLALIQPYHDLSTESAYESFLDIMFKDLNKTTLLQMYPYESEEPMKGLENLISDYAFNCASQTFIETDTFADVYIYKFYFESGFNRWKDGTMCDAPAVCHAADIPYTFHQFYYSDDTPIPNVSNNEKNFSVAMIARWSEFIKTLAMSGFAPYNPSVENFIEMNNTAPYFFEQRGTFAKEHNCKFWSDYYKVQKNP
ncbi:MAG: carboxylesterase family protein [Campylobacterota bacterium]|nr:carboxylesterase family protein [Campylobacterota bacterium]